MNNTGISMLSILIPSIPGRSEMLMSLQVELERQVRALSSLRELGYIQLIIDPGKGYLDGGLSIGKKREGLVKASQSKYLCFLDDDESVAPNYAETLLRLCNQDPDVCTFRSMVKLQDSWGLVDMRLIYKVNDQYSPEYTIRRPPWHICPVRSEYAKLYDFADINNAEDYAWFEKVLCHCTTEAHTDRILFQYNHGKHSEADKITEYGK
jgi:hypothetical protein